MSPILKFTSQSTTKLWSTVHQKMPKNIFNFTLKYLNNTLATRRNLRKRSILQLSACPFYLQPKTLQHIVSSCKMHREHGRYTWRHDSLLNFIAKSLSVKTDCSLHADLAAFLSPSIITGNSFLLLSPLNNRDNTDPTTIA